MVKKKTRRAIGMCLNEAHRIFFSQATLPRSYLAERRQHLSHDEYRRIVTGKVD